MQYAIKLCFLYSETRNAVVNCIVYFNLIKERFGILNINYSILVITKFQNICYNNQLYKKKYYNYLNYHIIIDLKPNFDLLGIPVD